MRPKTAGDYNMRKSVAVPKTSTKVYDSGSPVRSVDLKSNLSNTNQRYSKTD